MLRSNFFHKLSTIYNVRLTITRLIILFFSLKSEKWNFFGKIKNQFFFAICVTLKRSWEEIRCFLHFSFFVVLILVKWFFQSEGIFQSWFFLSTISGCTPQNGQFQIILKSLNVADGFQYDIQLADVVLSGDAGHQFLQSPVWIGPCSSSPRTTLTVLPQ